MRSPPPDHGTPARPHLLHRQARSPAAAQPEASHSRAQRRHRLIDVVSHPLRRSSAMSNAALSPAVGRRVPRRPPEADHDENVTASTAMIVVNSRPRSPGVSRRQRKPRLRLDSRPIPTSHAPALFSSSLRASFVRFSSPACSESPDSRPPAPDHGAEDEEPWPARLLRDCRCSRREVAEQRERRRPQSRAEHAVGEKPR